MKKIIVIGLIIVAYGMSAVAEESGYFYRATSSSAWQPSAQIVLGAGEIISFGPKWWFNGEELLSTTTCNFNITFENNITYSTSVYNFGGSVLGPCTIVLDENQAPIRIRYTIARATDVQVSPMNIISLPADNNGDVELLVETSTDLQTWVPVYSGSAGTSSTAAFFRTRLISN